ncbi:reverse transcriptase domain-containing protein [Tanacetum coccineum]
MRNSLLRNSEGVTWLTTFAKLVRSKPDMHSGEADVSMDMLGPESLVPGRGKHRELNKGYTSRISVAPKRNRILVYPDSDEDEEYYSLPLLPCFQTPQPCATFNSIHHNSHSDVDIDNMTLEEYVRYELAMSSMKSEIQIMPPRKAPRTRTTPATTTNTTSVTNAQLQAMIDQGVAAALATRDANRSTNGEDSHNSGTGVRRTERVARECTYQDFMKCQPLFFKGTEGVVKLTQWFERMETVFRISNCTVENQIKFSTCTLLGVALTWWNSHVRTVGHDVAYAMTWTDLKKKMTDKYCPRSEIKKLEVELWNLKVKGTDVLSYNQRFLALLCVRMFPEESDKIEKYVDSLPH